MPEYDDTPDSATTNEKLLTEARKYLKECIDDESSERAKMLDDLKFSTLDKWPANIRNQRENDLRLVLPSFVLLAPMLRK